MAPKKVAKSSRKGKTADKSKPKVKKAKAAKPEKQSLEKLSDQEMQKRLIKHKNIVGRARELSKEAQAALKAVTDAAKLDGVPKKEIDFALELDRPENKGIEKVRKDIEMTKRIARWMGKGEQLDLFGKGEGPSRDDRLFEDGRIAALNDKPARPPDHYGQADGQLWLNGHAAGRTQLNTQRAEGFKPLGETIANIVPPAPPVPSTNGAGMAEAA